MRYFFYDDICNHHKENDLTGRILRCHHQIDCNPDGKYLVKMIYEISQKNLFLSTRTDVLINFHRLFLHLSVK